MKNEGNVFKHILLFVVGYLLFSVAVSASEHAARLRPDGLIFPEAGEVLKEVSGTVEIMAAVDPGGKPASITVLSSTHPELENVVSKAVKQWLFVPASRGGESIIGMYRHVFTFEKGRFVLDEQLLNVFSESRNEPQPRIDGIDFPEIIRGSSQMSGTVDLKVVVNHFGQVLDVLSDTSVDPKVVSSIESTIRNWKFNPTKRGDQPVAGIYSQKLTIENGRYILDAKLWNILSVVTETPRLWADSLVLPQLDPNLQAVDGTVDIMVAVNRSGKVAGVFSASSTNVQLEDVVKECVSQWRFDPVRIDGKPVVGFYRQNFVFKQGTYDLDDRIWSALRSNPVEPVLLVDGLVLPELPTHLSSFNGKIEAQAIVGLDGRIASISLSGDENDEVLQIVSNSFKKWNFKSAEKSGQKVIGLFSQVFRFEDGSQLFGSKLWRVMQDAINSPSKEVVKEEPRQIEKPTVVEEPTQAISQIMDFNRKLIDFSNFIEPDVPSELSDIQGNVSIVFTVAPSGKVVNVSVGEYTRANLIEMCIRAAMRSSFEPTNRRENVNIRYTYLINEKKSNTRWDNLVDAQYGKTDSFYKIENMVLPESIAGNLDSGEVQSLVAISKYGYVTDVEIERGLNSKIDSSVEKALYDWKFAPIKVNGRATEAKLRPIFIVSNGTFTLEENKADMFASAVRSPMPRLTGSSAKAKGIVVVSLRVNERGDVVDARVVESANARLDEASIEIVKSWKYEAASLNGKKVASTVVVPFVYPMN